MEAIIPGLELDDPDTLRKISETLPGTLHNAMHPNQPSISSTGPTTDGGLSELGVELASGLRSATDLANLPWAPSDLSLCSLRESPVKDEGRNAFVASLPTASGSQRCAYPRGGGGGSRGPTHPPTHPTKTKEIFLRGKMKF